MNLDIVRVGKVSSINSENCTARVVFSDKSDLVSFELPILVRGTLKNKDYWMPVPGEQVVCVLLPSGVARGFVIGALYSEKDKPPTNDPNKRVMSFSDGTTFEYDKSNNTLTIDVKGPINITANGDIHVTGDVIADGISLKNHTHGGVTSGTDNSGSPVGGA